MALGLTAPWRQHHYMGEYANSTAADSAITTAFGSLAAGMMYYDTTASALYLYTGSAWSIIEAGGATPTLAQVLGAGNSAGANTIAMNSNKITGLAAASASGDAISYGQASASLAGLTLTGNLVMGTNKVTGLGAPSDPADAATKAYVDSLVQGIDWQESVEYAIQYVKAGAPTGTATEGEQCLDTTNDKLHTFTSGAWDAGSACVTGDRYIFFEDGDDTSGDSGTYTADNKIREYNGATFDETAANEGMAVWIEETGYDQLYVFNGTSWVKFGSTLDHTTLSNLNSTNYYHLTQAEYNSVVSHLASTANPHSVTLDQAYDAGSGTRTISVDAGNVLWDMDEYNFEIDLIDSTTIGTGFVIDKASDYFKVLVASATAELLSLFAKMYEWDVEIGYPANGTLTPYHRTIINGGDNVDASQGVFRLTKSGVYDGNVALYLANASSPVNTIVAQLQANGVADDLMSAIIIKAKHAGGGSASSQIFIEAGSSIHIGENMLGESLNPYIYLGTTTTPQIEIEASASTGLIHLKTAKDIKIGSASAGTGVGVHVDQSGGHTYISATGGVLMKDGNLSGTVNLSESGVTGFSSWFGKASIVGCLNELADEKPDATSNAGNPNGTVDGKIGDICWDSTNSVMYCKSSPSGNTTGWIVI